MDSLDLLILGDMHYVGPSGQPRTGSTLTFPFGLELGVRAIRDALRHGRPDAIVLLGDIVDRGSAPGAMDDLQAVRDALSPFGIPLIVVPGNHDDYPDRVQQAFGCNRGLHEINGYRLLTFADRYAPDTEIPSRPADHMALLRDLKGSDRPLIAIQHAVILPAIDRPFPYNFSDAAALARAYSEAGVCLSISGHYHAGLPLHVAGGVPYLVCPVLSEPPYACTRLRMSGRRIESLERIRLSLAGIPALHDVHIHTEFAYCADGITVEGAIQRLDWLGIPRAGILEHADQLYVPMEGFWDRRDANDTRVQRQCRSDGHSRHEAFRRRTRPLRSHRISLGLEIEPSADGHGLGVLDEDRKDCDYLIGAVHHLGGLERGNIPPRDLEAPFLAATRQVIEAGVDILAHPFRFFPKRCKAPEPRDLFRPVLDMLAASGAAAEINFHTYTPDPEFFALCMARGVKISLGSDSHSLVEVAELRPHLDLLHSIGASGRLDEVLWQPPGD